MQTVEVITVISSISQKSLLLMAASFRTLAISLAPYEAVPRAANMAKYVCMEFV